MNYDSSKTLNENINKKRLLNEGVFSAIKNKIQECSSYTEKPTMSDAELTDIATDMQLAFSERTWYILGVAGTNNSGVKNAILKTQNKANFCGMVAKYETEYGSKLYDDIDSEFSYDLPLSDAPLIEYVQQPLNKIWSVKTEKPKTETPDTVGKSTSSKEYDSKTHWVKNETAWQTLLEKLQWMSNEYFGGGKINITEFWVAVDQVKFHKVKELGSFAEANCGAKANPASGGQYNGEDPFSFKLKGTNIDAPITDFVTFYIRCEKGNKVETLGTGGKPEKTTQQKTTQQKTTQQKTTQQKTTQQKPKVTFTECSNTYSYGCKSEKIEEAQKCLKDQGLYSYTVDGKFGSRTLKAIKSKLNKTYFNDSDITTICGKKQEEKPLDSGSTPGGGSKKEEEYVWNGTEI
jgi:predicted HNH restriction endonuclease